MTMVQEISNVLGRVFHLLFARTWASGTWILTYGGRGS